MGGTIGDLGNNLQAVINKFWKDFFADIHQSWDVMINTYAEMATELFDPWVDTKNKLVDAGAQAASWDMQISEDVMAADPFYEQKETLAEPLLSLNDWKAEIDEKEPQVELFVVDPQQWITEQIVHYLYHYGPPEDSPEVA